MKKIYYVNCDGEWLEDVDGYMEVSGKQRIVERYYCYCYSPSGLLVGTEVFEGYLNKYQMRWVLAKYANNELGAYLKMEKRYVLIESE